MKINTKEQKGEQSLKGLLNLTTDKEDLIKRLYKEGKIKRLNEFCYSCPSECFELGITPYLVSKVLWGFEK